MPYRPSLTLALFHSQDRESFSCPIKRRLNSMVINSQFERWPPKVNPKIVACLPAFNEEKSISSVIVEAKKLARALSESDDIVIDIGIGWPQVGLFLAAVVTFGFLIPFVVDSYTYKIAFELDRQVVSGPYQDIRLTGFLKRGWIFSKYNIQGLGIQIWLNTPRERMLVGWQKTGEDGNFSCTFRIYPGAPAGNYTVEVILDMDESIRLIKGIRYLGES